MRSDEVKIKEFYMNCPNGMVVDHIIPIHHDDICGLHISCNLQYLTKEENSSKSNRWDGTYDNKNWKSVRAVRKCLIKK